MLFGDVTPFSVGSGCIHCPPGTTALDGSPHLNLHIGTCDKCDINHNGRARNRFGKCKPCQSGKYSSMGAGTCVPCEEHYEAAVDDSGYDAGCKFCRNGFYSAGGVDAVCKPCPVNFTSSNGSGCHLGDGKIWPVRASGYCKPGQYVPANLSFQFVFRD